MKNRNESMLLVGNEKIRDSDRHIRKENVAYAIWLIVKHVLESFAERMTEKSYTVVCFVVYQPLFQRCPVPGQKRNEKQALCGKENSVR